MSVVTGVILTTALCYYVDKEQADGSWVPETDPIKEIQQWLKDRFQGQQLVETSEYGGGGKHPQCNVWQAGINHMKNMEDEFGEYVISRQWAQPGAVILILNPEEGPMKLYRPVSMDVY